MDTRTFNSSSSRLRRERRAEKRFVLQPIKFGIHDSLMLGKDLKRGPHTVRSKEVNGGFELRAVGLQLLNHVFDPESHQKAQLIGKAGRLETM